MKMSFVVSVILAIAVGAVLSVAVAQEQPMGGMDPTGGTAKGTCEMGKEKMDMGSCCPACRMMMMGKDGNGWSAWHKEMMAKAGISEEMLDEIHAISKAPLYRDDPAFLLGMAKSLNLTDDQKKSLAAIQKEARDKAAKVLNDDQTKEIMKLSADKMTLAGLRTEIHKKMFEMWKEKMKEGKAAPCPMMIKMHQKEMTPTTGKTE